MFGYFTEEGEPVGIVFSGNGLALVNQHRTAQDEYEQPVSRERAIKTAEFLRRKAESLYDHYERLGEILAVYDETDLDNYIKEVADHQLLARRLDAALTLIKGGHKLLSMTQEDFVKLYSDFRKADNRISDLHIEIYNLLGGVYKPVVWPRIPLVYLDRFLVNLVANNKEWCEVYAANGFVPYQAIQYPIKRMFHTHAELTLFLHEAGLSITKPCGVGKGEFGELSYGNLRGAAGEYYYFPLYRTYYVKITMSKEVKWASV